ncbi:uncharacterized protein LOC144292071 [Canis aureus]
MKGNIAGSAAVNSTPSRGLPWSCWILEVYHRLDLSQHSIPTERGTCTCIQKSVDVEISSDGDSWFCALWTGGSSRSPTNEQRALSLPPEANCKRERTSGQEIHEENGHRSFWMGNSDLLMSESLTVQSKEFMVF